MKNWKKNFFAVILKHFENLSGSHHQIKITADYAKLNGGDNSVFTITALNLTNDELFIVEYFFSKAVLLHFGKKVIEHPTGTCCLQSRNFQNVRNKQSQFLSEEKKTAKQKQNAMKAPLNSTNERPWKELRRLVWFRTRTTIIMVQTFSISITIPAIYNLVILITSDDKLRIRKSLRVQNFAI